MTVVPLSTKQALYDPELIKSDFPIFSNNELTKELTYLDNAATTQKPKQVLHAISEATSVYHAPVNRGFYHLGELSSEAYESARERVKQYIHATDSRSVIFTASATDSINQITQIYFRDRIQPGQTLNIGILANGGKFVVYFFLFSVTALGGKDKFMEGIFLINIFVK